MEENTPHFPYLAQALAVAMSRCAVWRYAQDGTPFSVLEIFGMAKEMDEKRPEDSTSFYMVSAEGAIGLSPGKEYLTQWLFIPMEEGPERDAVIARMKETMDEWEAEEKAKAPAPEPISAPVPRSVPTARFCMHCGAPLPEGSRFCPACGATQEEGDLPQPRSIPAGPEPQQKKKKGCVFWGLMVVLAIFVIAIIVYTIYDYVSLL